MAFDIGKIIDFIQPSYNQLKSLLVVSLSIIGIVYLIGTKTSDFKNSLDDTNKVAKNNQIAIEKNYNRIGEVEEAVDASMTILYNDILQMNTRSNQFNDKKINLIIKYGSKNKDLLMDLMEVQNQEQQMIEQNKQDQIKYREKPNYSDSTFVIGVRKKKK
jgi:hypothetical protein